MEDDKQSELVRNIPNIDIRVRFFYYRKFVGILIRFFRRATLLHPDAKGGAVICELRVGSQCFYGASICSDKDNFSFKEGRIRSSYRAQRNYLHEKSKDFHFYENIIYFDKKDQVKNA